MSSSVAHLGIRGDLKQMAEVALQAGWRLEKTNSNHVKWMPPNRPGLVISATTPSDHRTIRNTRSQLRRLGLDV